MTSLRGALLSALLASTALVGPALAEPLPTGGQVVSGGVTIGTPTNGTLAIHQSSANAIVNWQGFSIGQGNRVDIQQPNASSAILNRVTGATPSTIAGQLNANGQVYLVNPNGIAITRTGTVNAAGFVASTLDIGDDDFRAGRRQFRGSGASAAVANDGAITINRGGYAALIGGQVSNAGTISVPLGKVGLGSGERATLDLSGDGFLQVAMPTAAGGSGALVRASGTISADGGSVTLTAAAARSMARDAVNLSGTIEARSVSGRDGSITLSGDEGTVRVGRSARLDASGTGSETGGRIRASGRSLDVAGDLDVSGAAGGRVRLTGSESLALSGSVRAAGAAAKGGRVTMTAPTIATHAALIDASGATGGGTVRIGGDRLGQGRLAHAQRLTVDSATTIRADATRVGAGGDVVLWSDVATSFAGTISATGGRAGGNGGQAEVSSKGVLGYAGTTNLTAARGAFGTLLLDPYNVIISNGANNTGGGFTANTNDSIINATTLATQLGLSSVIITTGAGGAQQGNITVAAPVGWTAPTTLTLNAANAISINAPISVGGAGGVSLIYNTASPTNLSFGNGASIDYGATNQGGTLSINNQSYALVYSMADLAGIDVRGRSALATNLTSTTTYTASVISTFSGTFDGLGHTISNLTIASTTDNANVGLFGTVSGGTVRDIGLVGGTVTGTDNSNRGNVGALVGVLTTVGNGTAASVVNAFASTTVSGGKSVTVGGLVGQAITSGAPTLIANSYATGRVSAGQYGYAGGLVGFNNAEASAATISGSYATGAVSTGDSGTAGGLTAHNFASTDNATITTSYATGTVTGGANAGVGGLVGQNTSRLGNTASISNAYATGAVVSASGIAGGLVGTNSASASSALISDAYATGAVSGFIVGGLVGNNGSVSSSGNATLTSITNAYATGAVAGQRFGQTGGLIGLLTANGSNATATVTNAYSTGSVTGVPAFVTYIGGSIGWTFPQSGGTITLRNMLWDTATSGLSNGIGVDGAGQTGNVNGLTTRQLQGLDRLGANFLSTATALGDGTTSAFSGGANGLYPYLTRFFPGGVQAVSGTVYSDNGTNPLRSGLGGAVTVNVVSGANGFGSATTGANGYYYAFGAAGSIAANGKALAYITANGATGATNSVTVATVTQSPNQTGVNLYANTLTAITGAGTLSAAAAEVAGALSGNANAAAAAAVAGTTGLSYIATGSGFTIDRTVNTAGQFSVETTSSGAGITVSNAITIGNGGGLGLKASGALAINAPIKVNGAGSVTLAAGADTTTVTGASLLRLSFGNGASVTYANADGSAATSSQGGTLTINGQAYTLLYTLSDPGSQGPDGSLAGIAGIDSNAAAGGSAGFYALATNLIGTGTAANPQFNRALVGTQGVAFSGIFEGLGHTITNLTMAATGSSDLALFEQNTGTIRNIGLVGGSISNGDGRTAPLVGWNYGKGIVANAYSSATVTGGGDTGGLVGASLGYDQSDLAVVINSFATGAVTGTAEYANVGGLVGKVNVAFGKSVVINAYATGAVTQQGQSGFAGGLVGFFDGASIDRSYATGAVSGVNSANMGGLLGINQGGTVSRSYWDTQTSGQSVGIGNDMGSISDVTGLTTAQFQSGAALTGLGAAFAGGTNGLYPYLASFFPDGVQVVSGTAYRNLVGAPLASGPNGAVTVSLINGGTTVGSATTGANGYYYVLGLPGTIANTTPLLAAIGTSSAVTLTNAAGATVNGNSSLQTGVNLYANTLAGSTRATTLTAAEPQLVTDVNTAAAGNADVLAALSGATGRFYMATGSSFTIDRAVTTSDVFGVSTVSGAALTASKAITVNGSGSLGLLSGGALAINAPVTVTGAGSVALGFDAASPTNLTFAQGRSIDYGATDQGGALTINGNAYTLLYSMRDVANQNTSGFNAIATNLDASATTYTGAVVGRLDGTLEGLGHTISGLTIAGGPNSNVGLIGTLGTNGTIRDLGLVGGSVVGYTVVGGLVGSQSGGTISNVYVTGAVRGAGRVGGLVGVQSGGTISNSYATAAVGSGGNFVGGLVGEQSGGTISNAYATGVVRGGTHVGGLVGYQAGGGRISNAYATGAVSGATSLTGGLVGTQENGGTITNAYWDTQTSGQSTSAGGTGLTTAQFQTSATAAGLGSAFAGGAGLYPYLRSFFPDGVQVVSGIAYRDGGVTPLASGVNGAATVSIAANGQTLTSVTTGANGYYYAVLANGTLTDTSGVAAYTQANLATGATNAVSYVSGTPGQITSYLDISGGWRRDKTGLSSLSTLDAGFATATGGTPAAGFALPNRSISVPKDFVLDAALTVTGTLHLSSTGNVTQTAAFSAGTLVLQGGSQTRYTLTDAGNRFDRLASTGGAIDVYSGNSLTIAANAAYGNGCNCAITGVFAGSGAVRIVTAGDLTIESGAAVSGDSPVLSAAGAFINNAGSAAVAATRGNWLIYSADSLGNTFGGLDSGNTAVWSTAAGGAITQTGNRYVFAARRTLVVTAQDDRKTYGEDVTGRLSTGYTITGFDRGVSGAYLADTAATAYTGAASVTSSGAAASANVSTTPYAIRLALGTLASTSGYEFALVNGSLMVDPRGITVTADAQSRVYGDANPTLTYRLSGPGLINGDTLYGSLGTTATATSNVGRYGITQGTLGASPNYVIAYVGADLGVTARALTVTADAQSRVYGEANPALTYQTGGAGLVNGDTLSGALATSATATSNVGRYGIAQGTLGASSNYAVTYVGADLGVTPRALTVTADAQSRTFGSANPTLTYTVSGRGLVNGDTLMGTLATAADGSSAAGLYPIVQGSLSASGNYALTYRGAQLTVTGAPRPVAAPLDASWLASTVVRNLGATGEPPLFIGGPPAGGPDTRSTESGPGFIGLTDPRFKGIVVCMGGAAAACLPVPFAAAPRPPGTRAAL